MNKTIFVCALFAQTVTITASESTSTLREIAELEKKPKKFRDELHLNRLRVAVSQCIHNELTAGKPICDQEAYKVVARAATEAHALREKLSNETALNKRQRKLVSAAIKNVYDSALAFKKSNDALLNLTKSHDWHVNSR